MLARRAGWKFPVSTLSFHFGPSLRSVFLTGCAAGPLPNGCLIVCGGRGNRKPKPLASNSGMADSDDVMCGHVSGYDEQGIVRGVLDSCEVGGVEVSIDVT